MVAKLGAPKITCHRCQGRELACGHSSVPGQVHIECPVQPAHCGRCHGWVEAAEARGLWVYREEVRR